MSVLPQASVMLGSVIAKPITISVICYEVYILCGGILDLTMSTLFSWHDLKALNLTVNVALDWTEWKYKIHLANLNYWD